MIWRLPKTISTTRTLQGKVKPAKVIAYYIQEEASTRARHRRMPMTMEMPIEAMSPKLSIPLMLQQTVLTNQRMLLHRCKSIVIRNQTIRYKQARKANLKTLMIWRSLIPKASNKPAQSPRANNGCPFKKNQF